MKLRFFIILILLSCLSASAFSQTSITLKQSKLSSISKQITSVKKTIHLSQSQKDKLQRQLEAAEITLGQSSKQLSKTNRLLRKQLNLLNKTKRQKTQEEQSLTTQHKALNNYIRSAYMLGREQYLKMILNQQDPETIDRYITYYHYLSSARITLIKSIQTTLQSIQETKTRVEKQTQKLLSLKAQQTAERQKLFNQRGRRHKLLAKLSSSISTQQQKLKKLYSDKAALENVIKLIREERYFYTPGKNFTKARGKLAWPIRHATITQGFNVLMAGGRMRTTGILLKAPLGTPIHAIFKGKVVFANWLRGYGLLIIVQHGKSFMTLYAHIESLYVKLNQMVQPGEMIATVGNSGGYKQSALYFEMRHSGKVLNPFVWLRKPFPISA